eukprot:4360987-Alexandrium_andersonii.AAC.1
MVVAHACGGLSPFSCGLAGSGGGRAARADQRVKRGKACARGRRALGPPGPGCQALGSQNKEVFAPGRPRGSGSQEGQAAPK